MKLRFSLWGRVLLRKILLKCRGWGRGKFLPTRALETWRPRLKQSSPGETVFLTRRIVWNTVKRLAVMVLVRVTSYLPRSLVKILISVMVLVLFSVTPRPCWGVSFLIPRWLTFQGVMTVVVLRKILRRFLVLIIWVMAVPFQRLKWRKFIDWCRTLTFLITGPSTGLILVSLILSLTWAPRRLCVFVILWVMRLLVMKPRRPLTLSSPIMLWPRQTWFMFCFPWFLILLTRSWRPVSTLLIVRVL